MPLSLGPSEKYGSIMNANPPELDYRGDFLKWRIEAKNRLAKILGLDGLMAQKRPPLDVKSLWRREVADGSIEKISFRAEEAADALAYLCIPKNVKPPYVFFICLQGHSSGMHNSIACSRDDESKAIDVPGDRDFALACMKRGVAALCLEQRGFGERADVRMDSPNCQEAAMRALMLGRTLLGERVYDVDRAIDYLMSRGDADPGKIGALGNSGGGTVGLYAGALLDRISCVVASSAFSSFKASIMSIRHCACNYAPCLLKSFESAEIAGLSAPKPLVLVNGRFDEIFPLAAAQSEFERVKRIYADAGAPEACVHLVGSEGHRFYAELTWNAIAKFLPLKKKLV